MGEGGTCHFAETRHLSVLKCSSNYTTSVLSFSVHSSFPSSHSLCQAGDVFSPAHLFNCLFVGSLVSWKDCQQDEVKTTEWISTKPGGRMNKGQERTPLHFDQ